MKYKPNRQRIAGNIFFCHGENAIGEHVDTVMKSYRELTDEEYQEETSGQFTHPLIFLREAVSKEHNQYCELT